MNKTTYLTLLVLLLSIAVFANTNSQNTSNQETQSSTIQRVRVDFVTPLGYTRHLLLGFTSDNSATDDVDYGYDALNIENLPDDLSWRINDQNYIIQGVGEFDISKQYPLGMFLSNSGEIQIALNSLENFETEIDVYVYDSYLDTFTSINDSNYINSLYSGEYLNRYHITFTNDLSLINFANSSAQLSIDEFGLKSASIKYIKNTSQINVDTQNSTTINSLKVYSINGQLLFEKQNIFASSFKTTINNIQSSTVIVQIENNNKASLSKLLLVH